MKIILNTLIEWAIKFYQFLGMLPKPKQPPKYIPVPKEDVVTLRILTPEEVRDEIDRLRAEGADPDQDRTFEDNLLRMLIHTTEESDV